MRSFSIEVRSSSEYLKPIKSYATFNAMRQLSTLDAESDGDFFYIPQGLVDWTTPQKMTSFESAISSLLQ